MEVFFLMDRKQRYYPEEVKQAVIQMKLSGKYTNREIMDRHQIKNKSQIKTWMRWFRKGESHRLAQLPGKQYSYNKGVYELSEIEVLRKKVLYYEMGEEMMGKYRELERKWSQSDS